MKKVRKEGRTEERGGRKKEVIKQERNKYIKKSKEGTWYSHEKVVFEIERPKVDGRHHFSLNMRPV